MYVRLLGTLQNNDRNNKHNCYWHKKKGTLNYSNFTPKCLMNNFLFVLRFKVLLNSNILAQINCTLHKAERKNFFNDLLTEHSTYSGHLDIRSGPKFPQ